MVYWENNMRKYTITCLLILSGCHTLSCQLSLTGSIGTEFRLTCEIGISSNVTNVTWSRNQQSVAFISNVSTCIPAENYDRNYNYTCSQNRSQLYLTIPAYRMTTYEHGTEWRCQATNSRNTMYSNSYYLNITYAPKEDINLTVYPNMNIYDNGTNVTLRCQIGGGNPVATLSWTCNGQSVSSIDQSNSSMAASVLILTMDRSYNGVECICTATHRLLTRNRTIARTFNVSYPPTDDISLTTQPDSNAFNDSASPSLRCQITGGNPVATLSWKCLGMPMTGNDMSNNRAAISSLSLRLNSTYNGQQCTCTATHKLMSSKSVSKTFIVFYAPTNAVTMTTSPDKSDYDDGTSVNMVCRLAGGNPIATLSWTCRGQTVTGSNQSNTNVAASSLFVNLNRSYNGQQCVCIATHRLMVNEKTVSRTFPVHYAPSSHITMITEPNRSSYDYRTQVTLTCQIADGNPVATLSWICRGQLVLGTDQSNSTIAKSVLYITMESSYNGQQCICKATHKLMSRSKSVSKVFTVFYAPSNSLRLTVDPDKPLYNKGESIRLICQIPGGNPIATLSWKCRNQSMMGSDKSNSTTALSLQTFNVDNSYNGKECICIAAHRLMAFNKSLSKSFSVKCDPVPTDNSAFSVGSYFGGIGTTVIIAVIMGVIYFVKKLRNRKSPGNGGKEDNAYEAISRERAEGQTYSNLNNTAKKYNAGKGAEACSTYEAKNSQKSKEQTYYNIKSTANKYNDKCVYQNTTRNSKVYVNTTFRLTEN